MANHIECISIDRKRIKTMHEEKIVQKTSKKKKLTKFASSDECIDSSNSNSISRGGIAVLNKEIIGKCGD